MDTHPPQTVLLWLDWFQLRPQSIAALAELTLCLVISLYLLSISRKTRDGYLITGLFILHTIYNAVSFFRNSALNTEVYAYTVWVHSIILIVLALYHLLFAYTYRANPFRREMRLVLLVSGVVLLGGLYFHRIGYPWTFPIQLVIAVWIVSVFLRKAIWSIHPPQAEKTAAGSSLPLKKILEELERPTLRDTKAYRVFALWCLLLVLTWLNANLGMFKVIPGWWEQLHHAFYLVLLTWIVINYMSYAEEKTTFLAKLVGLFMCLTLVLLGMLGFLLYGVDNSVAAGEPNKANALRILAYLIPISTVIIVLVFPVFFRSNLLRPLSYVLDGVKRVNAGELKVEVPVEVQDEIGALAQQFNLMTASLRRYAEQMESLVSHRTLELERKSVELETQKGQLQHTLDNLQATQAQLVQAEKMASLGELTAGIAHEIQNPLNFVNNFSELSSELVEDLEKALRTQLQAEKGQEITEILTDLKQNLAKIYQHGLRADAIVKGMLQHSRKSTGHKEPTDINALTEEYMRLSYHGLRAKDKSFNASLNTDFDLNVGKADVVPQDFGRVLLNVLNNAFYAVQQRKLKQPDGYQPQVSVRTQRQGDEVEVRVRDNGPGIPKESASRIFQPFFTTKPTGQGTGLGLSLSYDIITKGHGGKLTFTTEAGQYTEFIISVPVAHTPDAVPVQPPAHTAVPAK
ncbi:ATP-binding protein [Pontibacter sp. E15-1]|uniref:sensor histidine kinase n=1 Tax=Pontibacter sp. E15-1 TaxID=2919918 RepID=UPI001F4F5F64|nr:ATP-binding protein [Pontibacter sp. E15-1]MCJ8164199.1 ATP-binding protein [Pontibacter sp. E15-1]